MITQIQQITNFCSNQMIGMNNLTDQLVISTNFSFNFFEYINNGKNFMKNIYFNTEVAGYLKHLFFFIFVKHKIKKNLSSTYRTQLLMNEEVFG